MIKNQSWFQRRLEVEEYKKEKEIRSALAWIACRPHLRALLNVFVLRDRAFDTGLGIKKALLGCIARADAGENVAAGAFPEFDGKSPQQAAISTWLRNVCRQDLGGIPESRDRIVPISCNCDSASAAVVAATYATLGMPAGDAHTLGGQIHDLASRAVIKTWAEIAPFVVGPAFASCGGPLSYAEALLLPRIGSGFVYDPGLGAVEVKSANLLVIHKAAAREAGSILRSVSLVDPLPVKEVERLIDRAGWTVMRIS
jgi:hypothetical protein